MEGREEGREGGEGRLWCVDGTAPLHKLIQEI